MDIIILLISLAPGFAWLFFYLQEDCHPEPKRLIALTFFYGMLSALAAYFVQINLRGYLDAWQIPVLSLTTLLVFAFVEELVKFGAAYIAVHNNPEFDEPIDAMIYTVVAALGFATVENLGAITGKISETAMFTAAVQTASLRFVGATLLHTLASALIGYYWAMDIRMFDTRRYLILGIILAAVLHAAFNYLIIGFGGLSYALLFVVVVGFFILTDFEKFRQKAV